MKSSIPWRLTRTLILSFLLSLFMLLGLTFLLYRFRLDEQQVTLGIHAVYILSCLIGGLAAGKAMKTKRFFWGLLVGILYFVFLFAISLLQDQGIAADPIRIFAVLGTCAASGMAGGMLS